MIKNLQYVLSGKDKNASKVFDKVSKASDGLAGKLKGLSAAGLGAAGLGAGVGAALTGGLLSAFDVEKANDKLEAQLGAGSPIAEAAGKIAGKLYADAYGESVGEVGAVIRSVLANGLVFEEDTDEEIQKVAARAMDVATVFDQDVNATIGAAAQLLKNDLAPSAEAAFDVITRGFQMNVNKADDLLDTFNEYGTQFRELGLDAKDATGLLSQGLNAGARDADTVADALKEFAIIAQSGSDTSANGFKAIGLNAKKMTQLVAKGGPGAKKALDKVLDGLRGIEDPAKRNAAAVALFGTKAEDLQDALFALDVDKAATDLGTVAGAAEAAGTALNDNAATKIETFKRRVKTALVDYFGSTVIPAVQKFKDEFDSGDGTGGQFREGLDQVRAAAEKAWPHIQTAFKWTKEIVGFVVANKDVFYPIAAGVAAYALAMKAAATWTAAMAAIDLMKISTGIGAVGAASAAGAVGVGAFALPLAAAVASLTALYILLDKASNDVQNQANTSRGTRTATIGSGGVDSQGRPVVTIPGTVTLGGTTVFGGGRNGDDGRGGTTINNRLMVSDRKLTDSVSNVQQGRGGRGYLGPS